MSGFHHEAVFYASDEEYLAGLLPDLRAAIDADGAILVAVGDDKVELLRGALGAGADRVRFTDMERLGRNPACIIPAWREFMATAGSGPRLGIGEPVWPGRSDAELIECRRHESLLNLAFDGGGPWRLLCPYDVRALAAGRARRRPPQPPAREPRRRQRAVRRLPRAADRAVLGRRRSRPGAEPAELVFTREDLALVRMFVSERAAAAGLGDERLSDLVLAVNELATNSMRHGGGRGLLSVWRENGTLLCEVHDRGHIADPLAGRELPARPARRRARAVARQPPVRSRAGALLGGGERDPPAHEPRGRFPSTAVRSVVGCPARPYADVRPP